MRQKIEEARELLKDLELRTRRSEVPFVRRSLYVQESLAETKKQLEITV
jgi:hypothetical protein